MAGTQLFNFATGGGSPVSPGSNQYFNNMPTMQASQPGIVPAANQGYSAPGSNNPRYNNPTALSANSQYYAGSTLDPNFTKDFFGWLQGQIGKGATPFNLQAVMPSSGQVTDAGQLTAPMTGVVSDLQKSYQTGTMHNMLETGMPVDMTPAWQAMVESMQRQIGQGAANLKEQFNVGGGLVGSPYGSAATDYYSQTEKDLNAQLLAAQAGALENARGRQLTAAGMENQFGQFMQGLDQSSIDRLYQEFIRTRPEYNPLLNMMYGASTTFPPYLQKTSGQGALGGIDPASIASIVSMIP